MQPELEQSQTDLREALRHSLEEDEGFQAVLEEIKRSLPLRLIQLAGEVDQTVFDLAIEELTAAAANLDTHAIAEAVLNDQVLRGRIAIKIQEVGFGLSERMKADLDAAIQRKTDALRNLRAAQVAMNKVQTSKEIRKAASIKAQRTLAKAQGELLWLRISPLAIAIPAAIGLVGAGIFLGLNLPAAIACHQETAFICEPRLRDGVLVQ